MQRANAALVEMSMSRPLYERLMAVRKAQIPPALRYMLNRQLGAYRRAGVDKDETTGKRIAELQNRIQDGISSDDTNIARDAHRGAGNPAELKRSEVQRVCKDVVRTSRSRWCKDKSKKKKKKH